MFHRFSLDRLMRCLVNPRHDLASCLSPTENNVIVTGVGVDPGPFIAIWMRIFHSDMSSDGRALLRVQPQGAGRQLLHLVPVKSPMVLMGEGSDMPESVRHILEAPQPTRVLLLVDASSAASPARIELLMLCWVIRHVLPSGLPLDVIRHLATFLGPSLLRDERDFLLPWVTSLASHGAGNLQVTVALCNADVLTDKLARHDADSAGVCANAWESKGALTPSQSLMVQSLGTGSPTMNTTAPTISKRRGVSLGIDAAVLLNLSRRRLAEALEHACSVAMARAEQATSRAGLTFVNATTPSTHVLIAPVLGSNVVAQLDARASADKPPGDQPVQLEVPRRLAMTLFFQELTYLMGTGAADRAVMRMR